MLGGDREEFAVLVNRYQNRIRGFCLSLLSEDEAARDAAQEIFIKAFKGLEKFRGDSSFSTWLYRIAYNHCRSLRGKTAGRRTESLDAMSEFDREKAEKRLEAAVPADGDLAGLAARAIDSLPAAYRAAVQLRLQGADYQAIASALGVSPDSVKARLRRARVILRARLRHFLPDGLSKVKEPLK
ncbi:MAG: hypothetical protein A2X29_06655 [Elusimicrobia bacterium GWA2_64_40]|nr:MAG: hypothetical protein A2X29_06655 [Elusimicrobia bacterium GWA2_64_40]OGR66679.1 MAG: hypothetical protein A2X30_02420 [Elusimicrobia bacterium GWB2_63_16]